MMGGSVYAGVYVAGVRDESVSFRSSTSQRFCSKLELMVLT